MRKGERNRRNHIIIGLCAIVAIMAVGFAVFNQQLKINSTSEVTSTWCVGFDTTKTSDYVATSGLTGGTVPTTSMSYSGNTCGSDNLQTGASLSASFTQPGDEVVYTFTIKNASTLNAKLDSINENLTTSNSAIEYELSGASAGDVLGPNDITTLVVSVRYKNSVTNQPETTTWGLEIKLNFSQTSDSPSPVTPPAPSAKTTYYVWDEYGHNIGETFETAGLNPETIPSGKEFFLKYVLDGNTITEAYACQTFGISGFEPVCVKGGTENGENPSNFYNYENTPGNWATLDPLKTNTDFTGASGSCSSDSEYSYCSIGSKGISSDSYGEVSSYYDDVRKKCVVTDTGFASCYEWR